MIRLRRGESQILTRCRTAPRRRRGNARGRSFHHHLPPGDGHRARRSRSGAAFPPVRPTASDRRKASSRCSRHSGPGASGSGQKHRLVSQLASVSSQSCGVILAINKVVFGIGIKPVIQLSHDSGPSQTALACSSDRSKADFRSCPLDCFQALRSEPWGFPDSAGLAKLDPTTAAMLSLIEAK